MSYQFTEEKSPRPPDMMKALCEILIVMFLVTIILNIYTWMSR